MDKVCSNLPRPSVQKGSKGHQHWKREVFHVRRKGAVKTLCGTLSIGWLVIGPVDETTASSPDLCGRCKGKNINP